MKVNLKRKKKQHNRQLNPSRLQHNLIGSKLVDETNKIYEKEIAPKK